MKHEAIMAGHVHVAVLMGGRDMEREISLRLGPCRCAGVARHGLREAISDVCSADFTLPGRTGHGLSRIARDVRRRRDNPTVAGAARHAVHRLRPGSERAGVRQGGGEEAILAAGLQTAQLAGWNAADTTGRRWRNSDFQWL